MIRTRVLPLLAVAAAVGACTDSPVQPPLPEAPFAGTPNRPPP